jgi:hypothetical protein
MEIQSPNFTLVTEVIEPSYASELKLFGFLESSTTEIQDDSKKQLKISLMPVALTVIDANEPSTRFKWKWDSGAGQYVDSGFFKIEFDLSLDRGSLFTFEVLDKAGTVKFSRASNTGGWTIPSAITSYCGQEILYPASNVKDNNLTTEWRHMVSETHTIVLDMGSSKPLGGIGFYLTGTLEWLPHTGRYVLVYFKRDPSDALSDIREIKVFTCEHITLSFPDLAWEMRLRLSTSGTAAGNEYVDIKNIRISRSGCSLRSGKSY